MAWASPAVERAAAIRVHTAECECEGRVKECPAYAEAYGTQVSETKAGDRQAGDEA